jgi:hypothetical protein
MKIFVVQVENGCQSVLPGDGTPDVNQLHFNQERLGGKWQPYRYAFYEATKKKSRKPDMRVVSGGALALRADLKDQVFPGPNGDLEFLPIRVCSEVLSEDWYVVNCLRSTAAIDEEASILYRSIHGQIFMIDWVVVDDPTLEPSELFVLDGSNRANVLALPAFVERITGLGIRGITFREIGELNAGQPDPV